VFPAQILFVARPGRNQHPSSLEAARDAGLPKKRWRIRRSFIPQLEGTPGTPQAMRGHNLPEPRARLREQQAGAAAGAPLPDATRLEDHGRKPGSGAGPRGGATRESATNDDDVCGDRAASP